MRRTITHGPECPCRRCEEKRLPSTAQVQYDILTKASELMPNLKLWRNTPLKATKEYKSKKTGNVKKYTVSSGIPGQGDLSGIMGPMGRRVEIELKRGRDEPSDAQIAFRAMILACGGIYLVCRVAEETLAELEILYRGEGN